MSTICALIILQFCLNTSANSQKLNLIGKYDKDGISLKILPENALVWSQGSESGYNISRRILGEELEFTVINTTPILPTEESSIENVEIRNRISEMHSSLRTEAKNSNSSESFSKRLAANSESNNNYALYILLTIRVKDVGLHCGLHFKDQNIQEGKVYEYKVSLVDSDIESQSIILDNTDRLLSPSVLATPEDKSITLQWQHEKDSPFAGYYLEKSETGLTFERINSAPYLPNVAQYIDTIQKQIDVSITRSDTLDHNYQPMYYRLVGLDIWGDELEPSATIKSMGVDKTGPELGYFELITDTVEHKIIVDWEPSIDTDVKSYFLTQSHKLNGKDSIIAQDIDPYAGCKFEISDPIEMQNYYIKLGAIDTSGNVSITDAKSIFLPDHTPPSQVVNLQTEVDSNGVVTLSWTPSKDINLYGYMVSRSFNSENDFIKITDTVFSENTYQDTCTLQLLNNNRYYYVSAFDYNFNISQPSETIEVVLPDTIPPSVTYITDITQNDGLITIQWDECQSEDVASYLIYRKTEGDNWTLIKEVNKSESTFTFEETEDNSQVFKILAKDDSGNTSRKDAPYRYSKRNKTKAQFSLITERSESKIHLKWEEQATRYKVYQSDGDQYKLLDYIQEQEYIISVNEKGKPSSFYVKAYDTRGRLIATSKISEI